MQIRTFCLPQIFSPGILVIPGLFPYLFQLPIYLYHFSGLGVFPHMANFYSLDDIIQNLGCQFLDAGILAYMGTHFPSFHTLGKCLHLLQHIEIQHFMIDPMCFRADFRMLIVIHTQIDICIPIQKLFSGNRQWMPTAFAE